MAENNEFKGSTRESLRNINEDIKDIKKECIELRKETREIYIAITEIKSSRIPLKLWGTIGAAFLASLGGIVIALIN